MTRRFLGRSFGWHEGVLFLGPILWVPRDRSQRLEWLWSILFLPHSEVWYLGVLHVERWHHRFWFWIGWNYAD